MSSIQTESFADLFEASMNRGAVAPRKEVKGAQVPSMRNFVEQAECERAQAEKASLQNLAGQMQRGQQAHEARQKALAEQAARHSRAIRELEEQAVELAQQKKLQGKAAELAELKLIAKDIRQAHGRSRAWELAEQAVSVCEDELRGMGWLKPQMDNGLVVPMATLVEIKGQSREAQRIQKANPGRHSQLKGSVFEVPNLNPHTKLEIPSELKGKLGHSAHTEAGKGKSGDVVVKMHGGGNKNSRKGGKK